MIERIPPHNEEAERSVLGAAMLNKDEMCIRDSSGRGRNWYCENQWRGSCFYRTKSF